MRSASFPNRELNVDALESAVPNHVVAGAWKGETEGHQFDTIEYWLEYAKLLEKGKSHGVFCMSPPSFLLCEL